jgi:hypothetical protein
MFHCFSAAAGASAHYPIQDSPQFMLDRCIPTAIRQAARSQLNPLGFQHGDGVVTPTNAE